VIISDSNDRCEIWLEKGHPVLESRIFPILVFLAFLEKSAVYASILSGAVVQKR
jgi:hypothetical protein